MTKGTLDADIARASTPMSVVAYTLVHFEGKLSGADGQTGQSRTEQ
jgi:hypothetical protein